MDFTRQLTENVLKEYYENPKYARKLIRLYARLSDDSDLKLLIDATALTLKYFGRLWKSRGLSWPLIVETQPPDYVELAIVIGKVPRAIALYDPYAWLVWSSTEHSRISAFLQLVIDMAANINRLLIKFTQVQAIGNPHEIAQLLCDALTYRAFSEVRGYSPSALSATNRNNILTDLLEKQDLFHSKRGRAFDYKVRRVLASSAPSLQLHKLSLLELEKGRLQLD